MHNTISYVMHIKMHSCAHLHMLMICHVYYSVILLVLQLQLPLNTRITSLKTISSDECETKGYVKELSEARDTFLESAASGIPSAYVESQDSFTHSLQVAIPPLGITNVELVLEQLIVQRQGKINFEIPLMPNEPIDDIVFDLKVEDTNGEAVIFEVDLDVSSINTDSDKNSSNTEGHMHLDVPDARQYELPKTIKGEYNATDLPINGLLKTDGKCFEHFFSPTSLEAMPRNFHFVLDTSESMNYESKLEDTKKALSLFIDALTPQDTFTIQTFGNTGTEDLWGSGQATLDEKDDAKEFLSTLKASSWNTDLHEALLLGLLRAKSDAKENEDNVANILILISDGYATRGETNRTKIAEHVYELNEDGNVKVFSLGFQGSADMQLLDAIALMNGGVSIPLLHGQVDFAQQITDFLQSEVGSILMSDVNTEYTGASGETKTSFPVLSSGYEVVVRGLFDGQLEAVTHAKTLDGKKSWTATPVSVATSATDDQSKASLCFQSYAHDRITQLLRFYDASDFIGEDMIRRLVTLARDDCKEDTFVKCIRHEALALATEANIVAKGLTAMVTLDDDQCTKLDEEAEICLDGTTPDGKRPPSYEHDHAYPETMAMSDEMDYGYDYRFTSGSATLCAGLLYVAITSIVAFFF